MPLTSHPFSATTSSNSEDTEAISPYSNYVFLAKLAPELAKKRLIFIGDVHGNLAALNALLEKVEYEQERDHVIFTGDLIAKGNKSIDVVKRVRELGASCVIGNHDDKLIRWKAYFKSLEMRGLQYDSANVPEGLKVGSQHELIAREFDDELYEYLLRFPLVLDISEHNIYVVHAGLVPDVPITEQTPFDIMNMRNIDKDGTPTKKKKKGQPWIDSWNAAQSKASTPKVVIYGHNASEGLIVRPYTIGLDSGCGSGRTLTAMIWNEDRKIVSVSCASVENL